MMFNINFSAALNVFALSESTRNGIPLLNGNLMKQRRNAVTFISMHDQVKMYITTFKIHFSKLSNM